MRKQIAGQKQVACCWNVVSRFVPYIRKVQQANMQKKQAAE